MIENVEAAIAWTADSASVLYVEKHPETLLGYRIRRHRLGSDPAQDPLVYEQDDPSFYLDVSTTKDERYLMITAQSTVSTELRYARADDPELLFQVFLPRERDHEYDADHLDGRWIIRSNWQAPNFRLLEARVGEEGDRGNWRELLAHREDAFIHGFDLFRDFIAVEERSGGLRKIRSGPGRAAPGTSSSPRTNRPTPPCSATTTNSTPQSCATNTPHRRPRIPPMTTTCAPGRRPC